MTSLQEIIDSYDPNAPLDQAATIPASWYTDERIYAPRARNQASVEVGQRIQHEDEDICRSVRRGLNSRAYTAGRLSVRREAGEHLFHRLLHTDLRQSVG